MGREEALPTSSSETRSTVTGRGSSRRDRAESRRSPPTSTRCPISCRARPGPKCVRRRPGMASSPEFPAGIRCRDGRAAARAWRRFAGEIHLQVVAILGGFAEFCLPAERCELGGQQRVQAIHGRLVVARRFDLDQLPDGLDDLFPSSWRNIRAGPAAVDAGRAGRAGAAWFFMSWPAGRCRALDRGTFPP